MIRSHPKTARTIAAAVLNRFDPHSDYAGVLLNELIGQTEQKQRATDLVFGSIRNAAAIDHIISIFATRPVKRIHPVILNIIRIGAYELIYTPQTPEYAIVNDAVDNAGTVADKKGAGFVNAVLRQITRSIKTRQISLSQAHIQNTLPQTPLLGCEFDTAILPDPQILPIDYFSTAFSLPKWLIADWLNDFELERTRQICFASSRKPSIYIRANKLKTTAQDLMEKLAANKTDSLIIEGEMLKLTASADITNLPGFDEGLFCVQDLTAWRVIKTLDPQQGWKILDLCAAPGGKTTQLAEQTNGKAEIIATDIDAKRLRLLTDNISRLGIKNVTIIEYEKLITAVSEKGQFDAVVLDVPCSNTGVLAKRPEVRYKINPAAVTQLAKIQLQLLETAAARVKPQGKICYSTCSIQKQENTQLVKQFLQKYCDFELDREKLTLPSAEKLEHDGGYVAILRAL